MTGFTGIGGKTYHHAQDAAGWDVNCRNASGMMRILGIATTSGLRPSRDFKRDFTQETQTW